MPALPHPPPLSVYTPSTKTTCLPQNTLLYLNKQQFMNALLIIGWATLATWTIPNIIKDEDLRYGMRLVLGSMSIGELIGALAF